MKYFSLLSILLLAGCAQVPQWHTAERQAAEKELYENAETQIELNAAAGQLAALAGEQTAAALDYKLTTLPRSGRTKLLMDQSGWQRWADRRNSESMGDGSIAPMLRYGREESRLRNRFTELTVPEEVRQAFIALRQAPVRFQDQTVTLSHGELDLTIPANKREEGMPESEAVAQLSIPFCREWRSGRDTFHAGIIEPTNYGAVSSFGEGTESNLCVWKNGENIANYLVGQRITIRELSVEGNTIRISFADAAGELHQLAFDARAANAAPVQITHWTTEKLD